MLFQKLLLIPPGGPGQPGSWHMALDEAILRTTQDPVLRIYHWEERTVTFGYFMERGSFAELAPQSVPRVRRWTGGGAVDHQGDLPYSVIVPTCHPFCAMRPAESYEAIHGCLAMSLRQNGVSTELATAAGGSGTECFRNPVAADVLAGGQKVSGAGQRRSRFGMLHQGAIQGVRLDESRFVEQFSRNLAEEVVMYEIPADVLELTQKLHSEKYATREWEFLR